MRAGGAVEDGRIFGTGDPSPTRGHKAGRIRRGSVFIGAILPRQSLRHGIRRATSLYTREAMGAEENDGHRSRNVLSKEKSPDLSVEALVFALPIFTASHPATIVGVHVLNFCVRDGNRWTHMTINTNSLLEEVFPFLFT